MVLPMSNPTSISEGTPESILRWTQGKALVATGSPFEDVPMRGGPQRIGQANNVFIFPGLGLGTIISGASEVTANMISTASQALADNLSDDELAARCLMPEVARLWDVTGAVAIAVAQCAMNDGVAQKTDFETLQSKLDDYRWVSAYPDFVTE